MTLPHRAEQAAPDEARGRTQMPLGDPEEIDAILTSYKMGLGEGERQTVEKIVAWLLDTYCSRDVIDVTRMTAAIKRGEWK